MFSKTEYWDQLPSLSSESKREDATARFLRRGFPYGFFSRDTLFCLYNEVSYPDRHRSRAMVAYTVREECDERTGEYRENGAGEDRDPLHQTARAAIRIGYYLISHAKAAYAEMGADPALEDAKYVLRWIKSRELETFTRRDLHQATRGRFKRVEALEPGLSLLISHGYIREQACDEKARPGRRQSPTYAVNPLWLERTAQNPQNASFPATREDFECSVQSSAPPNPTSSPGPLGDADEMVF